MELLVKPEMLTSYIYEPTFGNAQTPGYSRGFGQPQEEIPMFIFWN